MKKGSAKAVPAGKRTAAEKLQYVKKNWQLYVFFLLPALPTYPVKKWWRANL